MPHIPTVRLRARLAYSATRPRADDDLHDRVSRFILRSPNDAAALQLAAGRDGPWHDGWIDPEDAARARRTTDQLAAIFLREQHSQDQELPLEF